jgi:hypothetical protein
MNQRGQAAIEFIMLILIVIIYLVTITRPLVEDAKSLTEDVQLIVRADSESKKIVNSITEVSILGKGTKKTLQLFVPNEAIITCDETKNAILFDLNFQKPLTAPMGDFAGERNTYCEKEHCKKTYFFPNEIKLTCTKEHIFGETKLIILNENIKDGVSEITLTG